MEAVKLIHLDTSFLIRAQVSGTPEGSQLYSWLKKRQALGISAIAWTEYLFGPVTEEMIKSAGMITGPATSFAAEDGAKAAELYNRSGRRRGSMADCMIAAAALRAGAALATSNPKDFARFTPSGLMVISAD